MDTQLLQEIRDLLKAGNATTALGFGHPPKARYIYANRQYNDALWYFWSSADNKHEPIATHALTGTIVKLEVEDKEFRGKPDPKVNLTIRADRTYIIQSGLETEFTKGLLQALNIADLTGVTTIAVEAGETDTVLFCRVYNSEGRSYYKPEWKEARCDADTLRQLAGRIQGKLGQSASAPEAPPVAAESKSKPVGKPVAKAVEPAVAEEDEGMEYEFTIDDTQGELIQHRGQKEFSDSIAAMTKNSSAALGVELAEAATSLGICYGQLETNFENQLSKLKAAINQIRINAEKTGVSTDQIKKGLDAASGDCTLAVLMAYAKSIAPAKVLEELPF